MGVLLQWSIIHEVESCSVDGLQKLTILELTTNGVKATANASCVHNQNMTRIKHYTKKVYFFLTLGLNVFSDDSIKKLDLSNILLKVAG